MIDTGSRTNDQAKSQLAALTSSRTSVIGAAQHLYQALDNAYDTLPSASDLQQNATLVQRKLKELPHDQERLVQAAYAEEIDVLARQIEGGADVSTLPHRPLANPSLMENSIEGAPNVKAELERGGRMDRLILLQAQERGLDAVGRSIGRRLSLVTYVP